MAQAPLNKLCLARRSAGGTPAECLASQKAGHFPCGKSLVPPPAPLSSVWLFIWIIKMGYRGFQAEANSHIIKREHHLVAGLFVCANSLLTGYRVVVGADPYKIVRNFRSCDVNTAASTLRRPYGIAESPCLRNASS